MYIYIYIYIYTYIIGKEIFFLKMLLFISILICSVYFYMTKVIYAKIIRSRGLSPSLFDDYYIV